MSHDAFKTCDHRSFAALKLARQDGGRPGPHSRPFPSEVAGDVRGHQRAAPRSAQRPESKAKTAREKLMAHESLRERYKRIKKEQRRGSADGCGEVIDLVDSCDEREQRRIAGRFDVHHIHTDAGVSVEVIEFLSDSEIYRDDEPEYVHSPVACRSVCSALPHTKRELKRAPSTIDPTRPSSGGCDLLCENEEIYDELAQSSSSDESEFSESSQDDDDDPGKQIEVFDTPSYFEHWKPSPPFRPVLNKNALGTKIMKDIEGLETCKPWRFVYRCLEIPFESTPRSDSCGFLFERWDNFWRTHGRAVWERFFWCPKPKGCIEYNQRKHRQSQAAKAFRALAEDLNEKFGLKIVENIKSNLHTGWWYRPKRPMDLVRLHSQDARLYALHLSRFRERWPLGIRRTRLQCSAFWCLREPAANQPIPAEDVHVDLSSDESDENM